MLSWSFKDFWDIFMFSSTSSNTSLRAFFLSRLGKLLSSTLFTGMSYLDL